MSARSANSDFPARTQGRPTGTAPTGCRRRSVPLMLLGGLLAGLLLPYSLVVAETDLERIHRQRMEEVRRQMEAARERKARLARERAALQRELADLRDRLREVAARRQKTESEIEALQARIRRLNREIATLRKELATSRQGLAQLLAALQRLRRDPPPPFVTRPDDALAAVRGAILLSAAVPALDARARDLAMRITRLRQLEARLSAARLDMTRSLKHLAEVRLEMDDLLARKRALAERLDERLKVQAARIQALARRARTLNELIAAIRREEQRRAEEEARRKAAEAARQRQEADTLPPPGAGAGSGKAASGPFALRPPVPWPPRRRFSTRKGRLPWPAQGRLIAGFGETLPIGGRSRGLYLSTLPRASVVAPVDVRVQMAGPFRTYGQLLILDAGEGYTILLAGLARTSVRQGQVIRAGEPLGEMGTRPAPATLTGKRMEESRPILYMELRHKGRPVDIGRWWRGARQEARRK